MFMLANPMSPTNLNPEPHDSHESTKPSDHSGFQNVKRETNTKPSNWKHRPAAGSPIPLQPPAPTEGSPIPRQLPAAAKGPILRQPLIPNDSLSQQTSVDNSLEGCQGLWPPSPFLFADLATGPNKLDNKAL